MSKIFNQVYIEKEVWNDEYTNSLLSRLNPERIIEIDNYKEVFNRKGLDWKIQKEKRSLILAKKKGHLIYDGSRMIPSFKGRPFYYNTPMLNCLYDCEYCYLRGMFPSASTVLFVNQEELVAAAYRLRKSSPHLAISYETDLLAYDGIFGILQYWLQLAEIAPEMEIECRTKSAQLPKFSGDTPPANFVLNWTLSPEEICTKYEHLTPPLKSRISAAKKALERGWRVRLSVDPILKIENHNEIYGRLADAIAKELKGFEEIFIGVFRINSGYLANARKKGLEFFYQDFETIDGLSTHSDNPLIEDIKLVFNKAGLEVTVV